jgi:hypothetical protein
VVAVNSADSPSSIDIDLPFDAASVVDVLNDHEGFAVQGRHVSLPLYPCWGRILRVVSHQ